MAGRGRRDPKRERFWRRTIGVWARSGETIRGFCAARGVSEASFHAWRRELRRRDGTPARRGPQRPRFLPVRVVPAGMAESAPIEIERGGTTIRLRGEVDGRVLARVLEALEQRPC